MSRSLAWLLAVVMLLAAGCAGRESAGPPPPPPGETGGANPGPTPGIEDRLTKLAQEAKARNTAEAWNEYGYALGQAERWQESAEACRKALALDAKHPYALYNLGWAEFKLGQHLAARTHIGASDALQKHQRWETRYALGLVAEALGEKSRAAVDYETAADLAGSASDAPAKALKRVKDFLPTPKSPPAGWTSFVNTRFGFRIFYPNDWTPGPVPENGDGRYFTSPDGLAEIRASGSLYAGAEEMKAERGEKPFLYGLIEEGAPSRDGRTRTTTYRAYRTDERTRIAYTVQVTAPADQWEQLQPVINAVMRSFRITFGNAYADF